MSPFLFIPSIGQPCFDTFCRKRWQKGTNILPEYRSRNTKGSSFEEHINLWIKVQSTLLPSSPSCPAQQILTNEDTKAQGRRDRYWCLGRSVPGAVFPCLCCAGEWQGSILSMTFNRVISVPHWKSHWGKPIFCQQNSGKEHSTSDEETFRPYQLSLPKGGQGADEMRCQNLHRIHNIAILGVQLMHFYWSFPQNFQHFSSFWYIKGV